MAGIMKKAWQVCGAPSILEELGDMTIEVGIPFSDGL